MTNPDSVRDELDIQRVKFDYAWACDNADWALLRTVFTEDAHIDYTTSAGPAGSRDEVCQFLQDSLSGVSWIHHQVTNFQIDLDGDRATVRSMFVCSVKIPGVEDIYVNGGFYDEEYVRTPAGWKIRRLFEDNRWANDALSKATP